MNFVDIKREKLSITYDGVTYSKEFYTPAINVSGVVTESHPNWDVLTPYVQGDYVIVPELKSIYKSSSNNTGKFPPSDNSIWTFWGFTNEMNMFSCDENLGSQTIGTNAVITIPFNQNNVLAIIDTDFSTVNVKQIDNDTNKVIANLNIISRDISCRDFAEYCYKKTLLQRKIIIKDLEWRPDSNIVLTFDGDSKIGTIGMGLLEELGVTLLGTSLEWESKSKIKIDEFSGYRSVIRYGKVRVLTVQVLFDIDEFNRTSLKIDAILDKNILFIPTQQDNFSEMISIGYFEKFKLPIDNPNKILTTTTIVGVVN
jgi:hypothetical protein